MEAGALEFGASWCWGNFLEKNVILDLTLGQLTDRAMVFNDIRLFPHMRPCGN